MLACVAGPLSAQNSGFFSTVTYNVAGLPRLISSSDPANNTAYIGQSLANYDHIHVQEDFNYHAVLYANDSHPHRTATSGGVPFGDGLNTLSSFPFTDFKRTTWTKSNGTDSLTPKGFTYHRVRLADGVYVDFYNFHTNAGVDTDDLAARRSNIAQLSEYITVHSAGNAVVVMGDSNCRYTRAEDNIRLLSTDNRLTDPWIELIRGGDVPVAGSHPIVVHTVPKNTDEVVDKIFYRGNRLINLRPSNYRLNDPTFFHPTTGKPLSDHWPVFTDFKWSISDDYRASDLFGGARGTPFNDIEHIAANATVRSLTLRAGARVDQVGITLEDGTVLSHGGTGGSASTLALESGEHLESVSLDAGQHKGNTTLFYAEFRTNKGRTLSGGKRTPSQVTCTAPTGWKITGFYGNQGVGLDKLGVIYTRL